MPFYSNIIMKIRLNPNVDVITYNTHVHATNIFCIISDRPYALVLDCTDNPATRYLVNDACVLTSRFKMKDLPQDVAKMVEKMQVGEISPAFRMTNAKGQTVCAIVKLKNRIDGHRANMTEDFQALKNVVVSKKREEKLEKWIQDKIASTYVRISPDWRGCDFKYKGWIK